MEKEHKGGMLGGGRMELWGGEQLWREQSIGRDAHLERKGVGVLPNEEECSEEAVKSFI